MLFKYSGKYVNIYFNMKITFPDSKVGMAVPDSHMTLGNLIAMLSLQLSHLSWPRY